MKLLSTLVVIATAALLAACQTTSISPESIVKKGGKQITAKSWVGQHAGYTLTGVSSRGSNYNIYVDLGGGAKLVAGKNGSYKDTGTWKVKGDKICWSWKKSKEAEATCVSYYKDGDKTYGFNEAGKVSTIASKTPGDKT